MKLVIVILALFLSVPVWAQSSYTDGRGNVVTVDPRTQQAINEAKALRGKYYADLYEGQDGVTILRGDTVYHFNRNGISRRGDLSYRRGVSDDLQAICGNLRPSKQERCIEDYREERRKLIEKYRD